MRYDGQFRLAHELKKHLHEIMGWDEQLTHRQYLCWSEWLDFFVVNQPSRTDHYLMTVACEMRRSYAKNPHTVKPDTFRLKFYKKGEKVSSESKDERTERIRRVWIARMTAPVTVLQPDGVIETILPPIVKRRQILEKQELARNKKRKERQLGNLPPTNGESNAIQQRRDSRRDGGGGGQVRKSARRSEGKDGESGKIN